MNWKFPVAVGMDAAYRVEGGFECDPSDYPESTNLFLAVRKGLYVEAKVATDPSLVVLNPSPPRFPKPGKRQEPPD